jgi:hypothetical protein
VGGRNKSGHDKSGAQSFKVMPALSRPKDGVLARAYVAGIHVFTRNKKGVDGRESQHVTSNQKSQVKVPFSAWVCACAASSPW